MSQSGKPARPAKLPAAALLVLTSRGTTMIGLGIVLIILGFLLPTLIPTFAFAHILLVIGVILLVVGVILAILGATGRAVGGRRHSY
jgi:uncharacterized membrane protein HdeD (DUF308 family)